MCRNESHSSFCTSHYLQSFGKHLFVCKARGFLNIDISLFQEFLLEYLKLSAMEKADMLSSGVYLDCKPLGAELCSCGTV